MPKGASTLECIAGEFVGTERLRENKTAITDSRRTKLLFLAKTAASIPLPGRLVIAGAVFQIVPTKSLKSASTCGVHCARRGFA